MIGLNKRSDLTCCDDGAASMAKRAGSDPDMDKFLKKLGKIARAKPAEKGRSR
jgi:hypothetical protein